jgi:hypothetical protein
LADGFLFSALSQVDDLINIFSEPVRESAKPQKLSLSMLQYNIMRVIIALFPLFRIIKQLIDLFKWERPAASMLALLVRPQFTTHHFVCLFVFFSFATTNRFASSTLSLF